MGGGWGGRGGGAQTATLRQCISDTLVQSETNVASVIDVTPQLESSVLTASSWFASLSHEAARLR